MKNLEWLRNSGLNNPEKFNYIKFDGAEDFIAHATEAIVGGKEVKILPLDKNIYLGAESKDLNIYFTPGDLSKSISINLSGYKLENIR